VYHLYTRWSQIKEGKIDQEGVINFYSIQDKIDELNIINQ